MLDSADGSPQVTTMTKAHVYWGGTVVWEPPVIYNSMCQIIIEWFPFDEQHCIMKFGSWTYYGSELDLTHLETDHVLFDRDEKGDPFWKVERGINIEEFQESVEWDLMSVEGRRHEKYYSCCDYPFIDITYYISLRRKTLFYSINLITPCVGIAFLTCLVFYLPSDSNNKITLCVSVLVSLTVFFLLLVDIIPATSLVIPLIGRYLLFTMVLVSFSVCVTVLILNVNYRSGSVPMSGWMRAIFVRWLPVVLCLSKPRRQFRKTAFTRYCTVERSSMFSSNIGDDSDRNQRQSQQNFFQQAFGQLLSKKLSSVQLPSTAVPDPAYQAFQLANQQNKKSSATKKHSSMKSADDCSKYVRACTNVCYIAELLREKDYEVTIREEWKFAALVCDRLFFVFFTIAITIGTSWIIFSAPSLWDRRLAVSEIVRREIAEREHFTLMEEATAAVNGSNGLQLQI